LSGVDDWLPDARSHEMGYGIRGDGAMQPFNLKTLVTWSLLAGALPQEIEVAVGDDEPALARVCRMLSDDLEALHGWVVPVKGRLLG
jgi:hypothetical protein